MVVVVVIVLVDATAHLLEVFNILGGGYTIALLRLILYESMRTKKFHLSLILTNQCNLSCVYCYESNKTKKRMDVNVCKDIIAKHLNMTEYDEVEIDFFGGEPFLEFPTIKEVCEWVWSNNWRNKYVFFATTNGVLITGKIKDWLKKHKDRFWVSLSLDGKRDSHNLNRSNSFDKIDINFFKECWPEQTVKMTISKETVGSIYENITFIHSLGYNIAGTNFAEGIDWGDKKYVEIVANELEKLVQFYIAHPEIKPVPLINMAIHKCEDSKQHIKWCGCGEHMAAYETDGTKCPCTFITPMTFNEETLSSIKCIDFSKQDLFTDEKCFNNCYLNPICTSCYGANLLSNGQINIRDKSRCELMKVRAVFSAALRLNMILKNPQDTPENRKAIIAIKRINELYNK